MSESKTAKSTRTIGPITWFEISAINFARAVGFYNHIFDTQLEITGSLADQTAFFPKAAKASVASLFVVRA